MAKIRRRSSNDGGGYQVRYYGPDGRRRAKTFPRRREAEQFAASVEADKARGQWVDPAQTRTQFGAYVASYLETLSHLRASTRLKVEGHLRNYILPTYGELRVGDIRPSDVRVWVAAMLDTGLSPATVKAVVGTFSRILNQAVVDGFIPRSPVVGIQLPKQGPGEEMRLLEPEQIAALATAIDPRFRTLIFTAAYTGLRWSELAALKVRSLDLLKGTAHVRESLVEVNGHLCSGSTKTGAARAVSLPRFLCRMLTDHLKDFPPVDGFVFTSRQGGPCVATSTSATICPR